MTAAMLPIERITQAIVVLREHRVLLDADLAELYGVTTKHFNQQVRRNLERFPADFMFRLTDEEAGAISRMPLQSTVRSWLPPFSIAHARSK